MPVPGSCPLGLSHTGLLGLLGVLLGSRSKKNKVSNTLVVEKGTLPKGSGAKEAPLPCENHVRELRTFLRKFGYSEHCVYTGAMLSFICILFWFLEIQFWERRFLVLISGDSFWERRFLF